MSWNAVGIMVRSMFGSRLDPIIEKAEALVADGTVDKAAYLLRTMAQNGTFDRLMLLSERLEEHNRLLREIRDGQIRSNISGDDNTRVGFVKTVGRDGLSLEPDSGSERPEITSGTSVDGTGMPGADAAA